MIQPFKLFFKPLEIRNQKTHESESGSRTETLDFLPYFFI